MRYEKYHSFDQRGSAPPRADPGGGKDTSLSAVVKEFLTRCVEEETEFERKKRLQDEVLAGITKFRGGSRISRDGLHQRGK